MGRSDSGPLPEEGTTNNPVSSFAGTRSSVAKSALEMWASSPPLLLQELWLCPLPLPWRPWPLPSLLQPPQSAKCQRRSVFERSPTHRSLQCRCLHPRPAPAAGGPEVPSAIACAFRRFPAVWCGLRRSLFPAVWCGLVRFGALSGVFRRFGAVSGVIGRAPCVFRRRVSGGFRRRVARCFRPAATTKKGT